MTVWLAVLFECLLSIDPIYSNDWEVYGLRQEIRSMLWLFAAFQLSRRSSILLRSVLLYLSIFQIWTTVVWTFDLETGIIKEIIIGYVCFGWVLFRSYDRPENAIPAINLKGELPGAYILARKPNPKSTMDVSISILGLPVSTLSVYVDGSVYGMDKHHGFVKRPISEMKGLSSRYAIKIKHSVRMVSELEKMRGLKFSWIKRNCTSCMIPIWKMAGLRMPYVFYYFPGLFLLGLRGRT